MGLKHKVCFSFRDPNHDYLQMNVFFCGGDTGCSEEQKRFIQTWVLTLPLDILKWRTQDPPLQQTTYSETDNPREEGYLRLRISQHYMEGVMKKWISRFELQTLKGNSCFFIIKAGPGICSGVTAFHTWTSKQQQNLIHFNRAMQ